MTHKTHEHYTQRLNDALGRIRVGDEYVHYRNPNVTYTVRGVCIEEATGEPAVLYSPTQTPHLTFSRPLASWMEVVDVSGQLFSRFRRVTDK